MRLIRMLLTVAGKFVGLQEFPSSTKSKFPTGALWQLESVNSCALAIPVWRLLKAMAWTPVRPRARVRMDVVKYILSDWED